MRPGGPGERQRVGSSRMPKNTASRTQQVYLVDDEQDHLLHVASVLPAAAHPVPFLGGGHNQVGLGDGPHVRGHVARELHHPDRVIAELTARHEGTS